MFLLTCQRLASFLNNATRSVTMLVLVSVVAGITEGAAILVVVRVAVDLASDTVSANFVPFVSAPTSSLAAIAIAGGLGMTTLAAHYFIARESSNAAAQVLQNTRARALRAFASATWATQARQRLGALQETVSTLSLLTSTMAQVLATGVANSVMLVVFLLIALAINPIGMAIVTVAGFGVFIVVRPLARRNLRSSREFSRSDTRFSEETTNFAAGAMELRAFGVSTVAEERLELDLAEVAERQRLVRFRTAFGTTLYRDVAVLVLIASVGALTVLDESAVGSSSAVVVLVVRALASAQAVNAMLQLVGERGPTVELLVERIEELEHARENVGSVGIESVQLIEADDVGYSYPDGPPVLEGVFLTLAPGEVVGLVGPSGSGKSTLLQLLLRLRRPSQGALLVNGVSIDSVADHDWARLVAYVPQEPTLFEGTVGENIAFYRDIPEDRVTAAAVEANVYDEIARLPDGFETRLGPLGSGLSGGQKQRVAIARALVGEPDVLILDEPSSALDSVSEGLFRTTVRRLAGQQRAVLIVAHRPDTVTACDRVYRMEAGRIVESSASHDEGVGPE